MRDKATKAAWLVSLGAGLEYYDFIVYGMMASYLTPLFFPMEENWIGLLKVFAVFAVGYFIRPLGGIVFGMIGDVYGRKQTFLGVMFLMAFSTLVIGMLPTYDQIGAWSSFLLILMRILQGLSFGAELPGAITVVCEYSEPHKQASHMGYVVSSISVGSTLASLVLYLLSQATSETQIVEWAWRLPFLLGGTLALANFFIRKHLAETPEFSLLQAKSRHASITKPFITLIKFYKKEIVIGSGMTLFPSSLVIFALYFPTFLSSRFAYSPDQIYLALTCGMIWSAMTLPFAGMLSDWFGKKRLFLATCLGFVCLGLTLFKIIEIHNQVALILFMMSYQTVISCLVVSYLPLLASLFPTSVRYTGIAACYNITYAVMGGLPMILTFLIQVFDTPKAGIGLLLLSAGITAISTAYVSKQALSQVSLE